MFRYSKIFSTELFIQLTTILQVDGKKVLSSNSTFSHIPHCLSNIAEIKSLLAFIDNSHLCCGNNDDKFLAYISSKDGKIMNASGTDHTSHQVQRCLLLTIQTGTNCAACLDVIHSIIRSSDCELLVSTTEKCIRCVVYRSYLRALVTVAVTKKFTFFITPLPLHGRQEKRHVGPTVLHGNAIISHSFNTFVT